MTSRLVVLLEGSRVGHLDATGSTVRFTYDDSYRFRSQAIPLSLSMPLAIAQHTNSAEAFLWGLLPDNERVLARWGQEFQVSPRNPFALLAHVWEDCAGAVQFVTPERIAGVANHGVVDWLDDDEVGERLRRLRADPTAWHIDARSGHFSLAGAQAKTALLRQAGRWGVPSGRIPTTHILKPAITGFDDHDLNEHLCLRAARHLDLPAARSEILEIGGERAVVVQRYDRARDDNGTLQRVHQEDFCQALGVLPTLKYQREGGPSPLGIVQLLRDRIGGEAADTAISRFVDALLYAWLIAGTDAHAKNYSLLLTGTQVRLAPLYDVASALPYDNLDAHRLKLAMRVGRHYGLRNITGRQWRALAGELGLDLDEVIERGHALASALPEAIRNACADPAVTSIGSALPERLAQRVSEHADRCRAVLEFVS